MSSRYVAGRLLQTTVTVWVVITIVTLSLAVIPGDPVRLMLGPFATEEQVALVRGLLGLDLPLHLRYIKYLQGLLSGDLGFSFTYRIPVGWLAASAFSKTLQLVAVALVFSLSIGIPAGVFSAIRQYSLFDLAVRFLTYLGVCIPVFVLGVFLLQLFSMTLPIFPVALGEGPANLVLPGLALALYTSPAIARLTRSCMLDVIRQDYIQAARAKGLTEIHIIFRHALRNSLVPITTYIGLQFGVFLGGSIITETVFAYPGMGTLMVNAILQRDYPLIQGCVLIFALSFILVNIIVDIACFLVDPRIRITGRK